MSALRSAVYGIPALLIAIIIAAGSFALVDSQPEDAGPLTPVADTSASASVPSQPQVNIGPFSETIVATSLPIVFDEDTEPDVSNADAVGLTLTSKERTIVNFIADIGDRVEITLHIDNLNTETETIALVNIIASDSLLIDVVEGSGTDEVRVVGDKLYVMEVDSGGGHNFKLRVTPLTEGVHALIVEIRALG